MNTLVEIRTVSKVYERGSQKVEVLHRIDLDIAKGDFVALMGPSGSGKTTLLNLIGGLDSPSEGSIKIAEARIDRLGDNALAKWRASNVGFVFQFYNLLPMLSAQKNVELPLLLTQLPASQRKRNASIALELVDALLTPTTLYIRGRSIITSSSAMGICLIGRLDSSTSILLTLSATRRSAK